jgi:hypothetical protein
MHNLYKMYFIGSNALEFMCREETYRMAKRVTDEAIRQAIMTRVAVPWWPHAGRALSLGKDATRAAVKRGEIPTLDFLHGAKAKPVPTSFLRKVMGLTEKAA